MIKFIANEIHGSYLIIPDKLEDERGYFARCYDRDKFADLGLQTTWVNVNTSLSLSKGTLRGLHLQTGDHAECKLVRCVAGKVWDVVVDLRSSSPSFGKWFGTELSAEIGNMMYIPEGCAHGFISISSNAEILYLVSNFYNKQSELTLIWNDPTVNIHWPIMPTLISAKDKIGKSFLEVTNSKVNNG